MVQLDPIRSQNKLSREDFKSFVELYQKQQWLLKKADEVTELIDSCNGHDEQALVCNLLGRFRYVTGADLVDLTNQLKLKIVDDWGLSPHDTKIVAASDGDDSDSSEALLYTLKARFADGTGWVSPNFINKITTAAKEKIWDGDNVVIVDDFVGTGKQMYRRILWMQQKLQARNCKPQSVYLCTIARHDPQSYPIADLVKEFFSTITLRRGISDHFSAAEAALAVESMLKLEQLLAQKFGKSKLPSLGFGKCETLYSSEVGNTPNNVFPIFWWKWLKDGSTRKTILNRLGG